MSSAWMCLLANDMRGDAEMFIILALLPLFNAVSSTGQRLTLVS